MKYKIAIMLAITCAQPAVGATCHRYSKWYYPYPQSCHNNKYTALASRMKIKMPNLVRRTSLEEGSPSPKYIFTKYIDMPKIPTPSVVVCAKRDDEREYGLCMLKMQLDDLFSDRVK